MNEDGARFAGDWLALREPADHAARSRVLAELLSRQLAPRDALKIVDLGAGTGSNLRWLAPRLSGSQHWRLLDHDAELLERSRRALPARGANGQSVTVAACRLDLAELSPGAFDGVDLVTASALFDLVSREWVEQLAERLQSSSAAGLFALTVDGRRWFIDPAGRAIRNADDRDMSRSFNRHQRRAKGLGEALGPDAARVLPGALRSAGMTVRVERSDWRLAVGDAETRTLGAALLEDWGRAAAEAMGMESVRVARWRRERLAALEEGAIGLGVGHVDVLALPQVHD